jgi:hypothetical protein
MAKLILVNPLDKTNVSKKIQDVENWRVIAKRENNLYLITDDCRSYIIMDMNLKQFNEMNYMGLDLQKSAIFDRVALTCSSCCGTGLSDWISCVVGPKLEHPTVIDYMRDKNLPVLKSYKYRVSALFDVGYFSRAVIPEAHEHCKICLGTGLQITSNYIGVGRKFTTHTFKRC